MPIGAGHSGSREIALLDVFKGCTVATAQCFFNFGEHYRRRYGAPEPITRSVDIVPVKKSWPTLDLQAHVDWVNEIYTPWEEVVEAKMRALRVQEEEERVDESIASTSEGGAVEDCTDKKEEDGWAVWFSECVCVSVSV